ncbi:unnamed protein product [Spirodela intermedia]|uniref:Uncharacterized protein n=1 Tax=Spirodela intermedia TaxID=51605 RepID=A0A7I8KFX9_SPIIN|nr:unnamed protein product [Spirodela intermedia]
MIQKISIYFNKLLLKNISVISVKVLLINYYYHISISIIILV